MKYRQGFISNSSSSSFIIGNIDYKKCERLNKDEVLKDVISMCEKYFNNKIKNAKKEVLKYNGSLKNEELKKRIEDYRNFYKYRIQTLKEDIVVDTIKVLKKDLEYWYRPCDLYFDKELVIMDLYDNIIPEYVANKIIKKYEIPRDKYCLHMG